MTPVANDPLHGTLAARLRGVLGTFARQRLPEAMVPSRFVLVDGLPKLPNGKVDRARLLALDTRDDAGSGYVAPETPIEEAVARIWSEVLGVARVGVHTTLFELGGDSLTAVHLVARLRDELGLPVTVQRLFAEPTVAGLTGARPAPGQPAIPTGEPHAAANPRSLPPDELAAEAVLPEDVAPGDALPPSAPPYRTVLLTGGTGYTGAYLLRELLERGRARIEVLVRAESAEQASARVRRNLSRYGLWRAEYGDRLRGVPGDLSQPYLGLDRAVYTELAERLDLIVHNGALSSYALPYRQLKAANVLGTLEVLRLACRYRIKPVHVISSLAVFPGYRGHHEYPEAELTSADGVVGGYRQTKWVTDRLVTIAARRGLPVFVYRPGQITGAQDTGACAEDTFLNAMIKGCVQLGAAPAIDVRLEMTPVDLCAAVVAHGALCGSPSGIIHLAGARPIGWAELTDLLVGYGYPLRRLDYRNWYRELIAAVDGGEPNELTRFLPLFSPDGPAADLGYEHAEPTFATDHLRRVLPAAGVEYRPIDAALIATYLDYFRSTGYLPAPGDRADGGPEGRADGGPEGGADGGSANR